MHGLLNNTEVRWVKAAVAAGATIDSNSAIIDTQGYESVLFVVPIADSVATGVATLKVEAGDANADAGMAAVEGAVASATSAADDDLNDKVLAVELVKPNKRYVQAVLTSGTANIAFGAMIAVLKPYSFPAKQGATVLGTAVVGG